MTAKRDTRVTEDFQTTLNNCCMLNAPTTVTRRFKYRGAHRDQGKKFLEVTLCSNEFMRKMNSHVEEPAVKSENP